MKFDFTSVIDRTGQDSIAIDSVGVKRLGSEPDRPREGFDFIPMWVADMSFATCPTVVEAIRKRLDHPLFGYSRTRQEYYDRIIQWQMVRHGHEGLQTEYIGYENGVHGFITSAIQILSQPGDKVLVHRPTYVGFSMDIQQQGRVPVYSELIQDEQGIYRMDYEDMDTKLKENKIHVAIFCSPHNPTGRVWERWELEKAMEVFEKNECYVISDEIWSDILMSGHPHIPTQQVNEWAKQHTAAAYALSKTFNLAGMSASYHVIYNPYLRDRICAYSAHTSYNYQSVLTMHALLGAYSETGYEWVEELNQVLEQNCRYMVEKLNSVEGVRVQMPEGTYMLFVDFTGYCARTGKTQQDILKAGWAVGVGWQNGISFGGPCHIRMNLAVPFSLVQEAWRRLKTYVLTE